MFEFLSLFNVNVINSSIRLATPIVLAALGAAMCNKAGVLNLAIDGKMLIGAFTGIVATYFFRNFTQVGIAHPILATYLGVLTAMVVGGLFGLFFAWMHIKYKVDLVILAIAINMLALEVTVYLMRVLFKQAGTWSDPSIVQLPSITVGWIAAIPFFGSFLTGYNMIVYVSWILAVVLSIMMYKTRFGRHIQAVGENIEAAKAAGISVQRVQYFALVFSGVLAGMAGSFLSVGHLTLFTRNMSNGRGWIGNAAALFGFNSAPGSFFAALFFGFADGIALRLQNVTDLPPYIVQLMPNILTIVILAFVSYRAKLRELKRTQQ